MTNGGPIGVQLKLSDLNGVMELVELSDWNLFSTPRITIDAHRSSNGENDNPFGIKRVIFNGPATIVFWLDGTKTVVKCAEGEANDKKTSILWAYAKKICGTSSHMNKVLDKLVEE